MNLFSFLMVLVSIIIGLGMAELLSGVARLIRARGKIRYYWVHGILTATIFIALLQQWWETWGLRDAPQWGFLALILMLVAPICLFLITHLLFPEITSEIDVEAYYYGPMRPVWALAFVAIIGSTLFRPVVLGSPLLVTSNATSFLGLSFLPFFCSRHSAGPMQSSFRSSRHRCFMTYFGGRRSSANDYLAVSGEFL